ncbi:hypothetical protein GOC90_25075 [Sinorhizobium medicae]|uniref:Uncharacterized protein n=2 Tax=Sinorhizobium medicae TaxID=110321 RepID=A6U997_SINMW|nr:hypothetical protein Smed_1381 [Sinorhizobium medicae WSM419]MDX0408766.1 hypothetical protein [Sinorhizobium medicae]MDX0413951.1 hypothetical protein [Sinorhizobium medicae]MDX0420734.1 hypothetical protein [Sinorhizobium medicae]MDX0438989.1 hypothetical protein [Sinorhizobium medicae]
MTEGGGVRSLQAFGGIALLPEDLDALQRVFDSLCREQRWPRESAQAQRFGRMLIREYQAGTKDETHLFRAGQAFISQTHQQKRQA